MPNKKRYDDWPPMIPRVGQVVQIQFGGGIFEVVVRGRKTVDRETFAIWYEWPWGGPPQCLQITPSASPRGMADRTLGLKPYWQIVPSLPNEMPQVVSVFFLD